MLSDKHPFSAEEIAAFARDATEPLRDRIIATIDERDVEIARLRSGEPAWTCVDCGSRGPFNDIKYDTPGEAVEHDMECCACESLNIAESQTEAFSQHLKNCEDARIEVEDTLSARDAEIARLKDALYFVLDKMKMSAENRARLMAALGARDAE